MEDGLIAGKFNLKSSSFVVDPFVFSSNNTNKGVLSDFSSSFDGMSDILAEEIDSSFSTMINRDVGGLEVVSSGLIVVASC